MPGVEGTSGQVGPPVNELDTRKLGKKRMARIGSHY